MAISQSAPEWRVIPSFPDYEVSSNGLVKRVRRNAARGSNYSAVRDVSQHRSGRTSGNYWRVRMQKPDGGHCHRRVHQLVAEAFHGSCPFEGAEVAHNDGNKDNNDYRNLRWSSSAENHADTVKHLSHAGTRNHKAVLTEADVIEIRATPHQPLKAAALKYGVTPPTIGKAILRRTWRHIA